MPSIPSLPIRSCLLGQYDVMINTISVFKSTFVGLNIIDMLPCLSTSLLALFPGQTRWETLAAWVNYSMSLIHFLHLLCFIALSLFRGLNLASLQVFLGLFLGSFSSLVISFCLMIIDYMISFIILFYSRQSRKMHCCFTFTYHLLVSFVIAVPMILSCC